jgi:hypothetical protein
MRRRLIRLIGPVVVLALVPAVALGGAGTQGKKNKSVVLKAKLTGAAEVPGPGDPDGSGKAKIRVKAKKGKVCFKLRWEDISEPTAAHIHEGPAGVAGDVVVPLFVPPAEPTRKDCVDGLDTDLLRDIRRNPSEYYVNIHTEDFPAGAIRGQLEKKKKKAR